jgi:hypothetical protein
MSKDKRILLRTTALKVDATILIAAALVRFEGHSQETWRSPGPMQRRASSTQGSLKSIAAMQDPPEGNTLPNTPPIDER